MLRRHFILIINCILLLFSAPSFSNEKLNWQGQIESKNIVINNQFGDVRLRYGGDNEYLEYVAVLQNTENKGELFVQNNKTKNVFYISTDRKNFEKNNKIFDKARIDITVFIPKDKSVKVQTNKGKVDSKGLKSNLKIITETGDIVVRKHSGLLNTTNNTGKTTIVLKNTEFSKKQKFESIYGDIYLTISNKSNLHIQMSTSSHIISDFSLDMTKHRHSEPNKTATIKNNNASSHVIMYSKRGNLALKEHVEFE